MCAGDAEAGQRLVRMHYGAIYRYLLSLARQAERAADRARELTSFLEEDTVTCWHKHVSRGSA